MKNHIAFVVYPGFELLDLSGPMSVFSSANSLSSSPKYELSVFSAAGGLITSSAGLSVMTQQFKKATIDKTSTALVVGANIQPLQEASTDKVLLAWLSQHMPLAERFGSICSGTFLLRAAGLLSERTVTTHWAGCQTLAQMGNDFSVLKDALYHVDGNCWTSAGVTTGIDMAMEMLKRDHGIELMQAVAKSLVIYAQRPGKQSQFSHAVDLKPNQEEGFSELIVWLKKEVTRQIKVSEMADYMCMSERSFQRRFTDLFSVSPARFFERMRMEYARDFLLPKYSVEGSARHLGYRSVAAFRSGFEKHFGISPSVSKRLG